jgi:hypothetical protein
LAVRPSGRVGAWPMASAGPRNHREPIRRHGRPVRYGLRRDDRRQLSPGTCPPSSTRDRFRGRIPGHRPADSVEISPCANERRVAAHHPFECRRRDFLTCEAELVAQFPRCQRPPAARKVTSGRLVDCRCPVWFDGRHRLTAEVTLVGSQRGRLQDHARPLPQLAQSFSQAITPEVTEAVDQAQHGSTNRQPNEGC